MASIDPWNFIMEWWLQYQPFGAAKAEDIKSGLKKQQKKAESLPHNVKPAVKGSLQTAACQYWVKGLPNVCNNWDANIMKCTFVVEGGENPSGWGASKTCDRLGRRNWCTEYRASGEFDPNKYACILPCIEKSGSGKITDTSTEETEEAPATKGFIIAPWAPEEIIGYNPTDDDKKEGQCDGWGMGRGKPGFGIDGIELLQLNPQICKHYKPHQLGFGAVNPRPYHGDPESPVFIEGQTYIPKTLNEIFDGSLADPLTVMKKRLPYAFDIYNMRAQFQKCAHWKENFGERFYVDVIGSDPTDIKIYIDMAATNKCAIYEEDRAEKDSVIPFVELSDIDDTMPEVLKEIWAKKGTVVCNGAKPECPCYTGKWIYCIDRNMQDGMRITADQVLELRFWASNWSSKEEYDRFYEAKPGTTQGGFADVTTSDIYTFDKWEVLVIDDPNESIMKGFKHAMCMPAPPHKREFDSEVYVTKTAITYPKAGTSTGTSTPEAVAFPTLVRALEDTEGLLPDIFVIYPYATKEPWDLIPCEPPSETEVCEHPNSLMYGSPEIMTVGYTIKERKVWAINATYIYEEDSLSNPAISKMRENIRANTIPEAQYEKFCANVAKLIKEAENNGTSGIVSGETDGTGFFRIPGLALVNNKANEIFIICEWNANKYVYRSRKVRSKYYGGLITQKTFNSEVSGENWAPMLFRPAASITGQVSTINGKVGSVKSCHSFARLTRDGYRFEYGYCLNWKEEEGLDIDNWAQVGPTGYIWFEIDNKDINYFFDFKIIEINMVKKNSAVKICGASDEESAVDFEQVEFDNNIRKQIPANAVLIRNKGAMKRFFNSDWKLSVKYKYAVFENEKGEDVMFPEGIGTDANSVVRFTASPYSVNLGTSEEGSTESLFEIPRLSGYTPAVIAFILDDDDRIQSAAATKMLSYAHRLGCRNVEIEYIYMGYGAAYTLQPADGFFTWMGNTTPREKAEDYEMPHVSLNKCGDHDCDPGNCIGPMWFPYDMCVDDAYYSVINGAGQCTSAIAAINGPRKVMGNAAWRYGLPDTYSAWVTPGGNNLATCGASFAFHYSHLNNGSVRFIGKAQIRSIKSLAAYTLTSGWMPPPFGANAREYVERWIIRDFTSAYYNGDFYTTYVPLVLDVEDITSELNCFAFPGISSHPRLNEPFFHRSMLSNYVATKYLDENYDLESRERFEDIIEPVKHGSYYPWGFIAENGDAVGIGRRYKFKENRIVWCWPEYWRDIERAQNGTDKLGFIRLYKPNYYIDIEKKRHRLIIDEGDHKIMFRPPEEDHSESGNSGEPIETFASVSIDGGNWRYFKILYDESEYNAEKVDWQDEGGEAGGSGGTVDSLIYEEANNGPNGRDPGNGPTGSSAVQWIHDFDTLFDPIGSSSNIDLVGHAKIGEHGAGLDNITGYYNRGIIANIYKSKLNLLPIKEEMLDEPEVKLIGNLGQPPPAEGGLGQLTAADMKCIWTLDGVNVVKITIRGQWGLTKEENPQEGEDPEDIRVDRPRIYCSEIDGEEESTAATSIYTVDLKRYSSEPNLGDKELEDFDLEINLSTYPNRVLKAPNKFVVDLGGLPDDYIKVDSIIAYSGRYVEAVECIKVWEQRFRTSSKEGTTINADGPDSESYRSSYDTGNTDSSGQFFPNQRPASLTAGGTVLGKTTIVNSASYKGDDEIIPCSKDTLKDVEKNAQGDLYKAAFNLASPDNNEITLETIFPPDIHYFMDEVLGYVGNLERSRKVVMKNNLVEWSNHSLNKHLNQSAGFWNPGGHFFEWSRKYVTTRCYILGNPTDVYNVEFVHYKHAGNDDTPDALHSFYGYISIEYQSGAYSTAQLLGSEATGVGHTYQDRFTPPNRFDD